jgi:hypothetical protein
MTRCSTQSRQMPRTSRVLAAQARSERDRKDGAALFEEIKGAVGGEPALPWLPAVSNVTTVAPNRWIAC